MKINVHPFFRTTKINLSLFTSSKLKKTIEILSYCSNLYLIFDLVEFKPEYWLITNQDNFMSVSPVRRYRKRFKTHTVYLSWWWKERAVVQTKKQNKNYVCLTTAPFSSHMKQKKEARHVQDIALSLIFHDFRRHFFIFKSQRLYSAYYVNEG